MDDTPPAPAPRSTAELSAPTSIASDPAAKLQLATGWKRDSIVRFGEQIIFVTAVIGAVALGLGITDYFRDHRYISAYLIAYIGFRFAELMVGEDPRHPAEPADAHAQRIMTEIVVLILFAAAPFERTYLYGGEPEKWVGALGLLLELGGLWLALGARIQLHFFSSDRSGRERMVLVKTGFFRYVRHPVYVGVLLVLFAWPLEFAAPIVATLTLVAGLLIANRQIRADEETLAARFGAEFEDYKRTTDALIPSIW
ncbi:MAG TPA: isoprenylcysteine carboxylmethyltransferase family protein [Candidatus Binataceae bacterium]|nr:isoprenylcysteine carboxylmethyltransferase family protein [Candidatus Binataceae bacterium]